MWWEDFPQRFSTIFPKKYHKKIPTKDFPQFFHKISTKKFPQNFHKKIPQKSAKKFPNQIFVSFLNQNEN